MNAKYFLLAGTALVLMGACNGMRGSDAVISSERGERLSSLVTGEGNRVKPGERFTITLEANPTTGYQWVIENRDSLKCVKFVSEHYAKSTVGESGVKPVCGASRVAVFSFEAVSPGKETVMMVYKRSWEKKKPFETRRFQVEVVE